jgi:hypothetical protein
MDFVTIPSPGMPDGPCRGSCGHPKCHALRSLAEDHCAHCGLALGFGGRITGEPPVHARCAAGAQVHDDRGAKNDHKGTAHGHTGHHGHNH